MLEALIKNAEKLKEGKEYKPFEIKISRFEEIGIEGNVKIKKPDTSILNSYLERNRDIKYLISECMVEPDLGNKELLSTFKVRNKKELVSKLFTEEEIYDLDVAIGKIINKTRSASLVDDIKN
ncbi:MAG: hypothetical protein JXM74_04700 [Fusobacteriaceae bacterium]|jgi:hypothetical protein|nr:hypothetical protein [Fusobacteriaceae bacterium]MBN2838035.1 hypothetical protein [Fusobacteriaceae bacterium]